MVSKIQGGALKVRTQSLVIHFSDSFYYFGTDAELFYSAATDYDKVLSKIPNHKIIKIESRTVDDGVKLVYLDDPRSVDKKFYPRN